MANSGQCTYSSGGHPACNACGAIVFRRAEHAHIFRVNPRREDVLCGRCFVACAAAAVPVFKAAEALGIDPTAPSIHDALDSGMILVLHQTVLGFEVPLN